MVGVCICRARPDGRHNEIRGKKGKAEENQKFLLIIIPAPSPSDKVLRRSAASS